MKKLLLLLFVFISFFAKSQELDELYLRDAFYLADSGVVAITEGDTLATIEKVRSTINDSLSVFVGSQWEDSTGGIVYTGGNVGIGTANPLSALHLNKGTGLSNGLTLDSDGNSGFSLFGTDAVSGFVGNKEIFRIVENTTEQFIINPQGDFTGTDAAPNLAFSSSGTNNTGFYLSGTNILRTVINGTKMMTFTTTDIQTRNFNPISPNAYDLGSSILLWNELWINNINNTTDVTFNINSVAALTINDAEAHSVAGIANYETLVIADDDIPNKKYVDDNAGGGGYTSHIHSTAPTQNTIFDALDSYIPNTSDKILIDGSIAYVALTKEQLLVISYAERTSSTVITFYGVKHNITDGITAISTKTVTDGQATAIPEVSIAW